MSLFNEIIAAQQASKGAKGGYGYEEKVTAEVLPLTTIEIAENADLGFPVCIMQPFADLMGGDDLAVDWDGVKYALKFHSDTFVGFGNLAITGEGEDTGEPFCYAVINGAEGEVFAIILGDIGKHTLSVSRTRVVVRTIDPKYTPGILPVVELADTIEIRPGTIVDLSANDALRMDAVKGWAGPIIVKFHASVGGEYNLAQRAVFNGCTTTFNTAPGTNYLATIMVETANAVNVQLYLDSGAWKLWTLSK